MLARDGAVAPAPAGAARDWSDRLVAFVRPRLAHPDQAFDVVAEILAAIIVAAPHAPGRDHVAVYSCARRILRGSLLAGAVEDRVRRRLELAPFALTDDDLAEVELRARAGARALRADMAALPDPVRRALMANPPEQRHDPTLALRVRCTGVTRAAAADGPRAFAELWRALDGVASLLAQESIGDG